MKINHDNMAYEGVTPICVECAWDNLLDIADAGVIAGETLLFILNKMLEEHPHEMFGPRVGDIASTLRDLRADVDWVRTFSLTPDDISEAN